MRERGAATLVLTRSDVRRLLPLADCIDAVEQAFRRNAEAQDPPARMLGLHVTDGGFHAKAAVLGRYFAAKLNANFPFNPGRTGRPTIQGIVVLADTTDGRVLALMDSIEITILRTAAATALATRHLARADATVVTVCGCGIQGAIQLEALVKTRAIKHALAYDRDGQIAERFALERAASLGVVVEPTDDLPAALRRSDIVVTCTPAREPLIRSADVRPGTFIAAVGADSEGKQEIDPRLLADAKVVTDLTRTRRRGHRVRFDRHWISGRRGRHRHLPRRDTRVGGRAVQVFLRPPDQATPGGRVQRVAASA